MSSGSDRSRLAVAPALLAVLLAMGSPADAQQPCGETRGWIGISGLACNCTVQTGGDTPIWSFRSEPRVLAVADGSPASSVLRPGDTIVAVEGVPITTEQAGRRFGAPQPGAPMRLTIRRDGRLSEVIVQPDAVCEGDPRLDQTTPAAPLARGQGRTRGAAPARAPRAGTPAPAGVSRPPAVAGRAPAAPAIVPPLPPETPQGWFGFSISCGRCGWEQRAGDERPRWNFEGGPPRLIRVEAGTPADRAGLRPGDILAAIDGVPLTTPRGGQAFGNVRPGQAVRWTYLRAGNRRTAVVRAVERPTSATPAPASSLAPLPRQPAPQAPVRFRDLIGNVEVEVEGGPGVVTTIVEEGRDLIIDTGTARIRVRVLAPPGRR